MGSHYAFVKCIEDRHIQVHEGSFDHSANPVCIVRAVVDVGFEAYYQQ